MGRDYTGGQEGVLAVKLPPIPAYRWNGFSLRCYRLHLKGVRSRVQIVYRRERPGDGTRESDKA